MNRRRGRGSDHKCVVREGVEGDEAPYIAALGRELDDQHRGRCSNVDASSQQRFHSFAETGDVGEGERETFLAVVPERLREMHRKPRDCVARKGDPHGLHCRTGAPGCAPGQTGCHHRTEHNETRRGFQHYYRTVLLETDSGPLRCRGPKTRPDDGVRPREMTHTVQHPGAHVTPKTRAGRIPYAERLTWRSGWKRQRAPTCRR